MKYILFSDIHCGQTTEFSKPKEYEGYAVDSRLIDVLAIFKYVGKLAKSHKAKGIIFLGDLFHDRYVIDVATLHFVRREITRLAKICRVYLLKGNHDEYYDDEDMVTSLSSLSDIKNVKIITKPYHIEGKGYRHVFLPYAANPLESLRVYSSDLPKDSKAQYLFAHLTPNGAKVSGSELLSDIPVETDTKAYARYDACFTGHIHKPQQVGVWRILGSTHQINRGERNETKYIYALETKNGSLKRYPTSKVVPSFVDVEANTKQQLLEHEDKIQGNYVRAVLAPSLKTSYPKLIDKLQNSSAGWSEYYRSDKSPEIQYVQRKEFPDLMRQYVEENKPENLKAVRLMDIGNELIDGLTLQFHSGKSIVLREIKIRNLMCHSKLDLLFQAGKITRLTGNNGAGKSALIEAIVWILTGKTVRNIKAARIIRSGRKLGWGQIELHYDNSRWVVKRSRKRGEANKLIVKCDNQPIKLSGPAHKKQRQLEDMLGISPELLKHTSFIMVKSPVFAELPSTEKANLLLDSIVGAGALNKAAQNARRTLRETQGVVDVLSGSLSALDANLTAQRKLLQGVKQDKSKKLKIYAQKRDKRKRYLYEYKRLTKQIEKFDKLKWKNRKEINKLNNQSDKYETEIHNLNRDLEDINSYLSGGACPSCGSALKKAPKKADWKQEAKKIEDRIHALEKKRIECKDEVTVIVEKSKKTDKSWRRVHEKRDALEVIEKPKKPEFPEYEKVRKSITDLKKKIKKDKKKLRLKSRKMEYVKFWVDAFSSTGLRNMIISSVVGLLDHFVSDTVSDISGGEIQAGVTVDKKGKIEVVVKTKKGGETYDEASSGQQARVDMAMMRGLEAVSANYGITFLDTKFIDEKYAYVDEPGKIKILEDMRTAAKTGMGKYVIVDRNPVISPYVDKTIKVG